MKIHNDSNAKQIVASLREAGAIVHWWVPSARQKGQPDLVVGFRGITYLIEIKGPKGELNEAQEKFHSTWIGGPIAVVRTEVEALIVIGLAP